MPIAREGLLPFDSVRDLGTIRRAVRGGPFEDPPLPHRRLGGPPFYAWLVDLVWRALGVSPEYVVAFAQAATASRLPVALQRVGRRVIGRARVPGWSGSRGW